MNLHSVELEKNYLATQHLKSVRHRTLESAIENVAKGS